jgi:hypothetical protein
MLHVGLRRSRYNWHLDIAHLAHLAPHLAPHLRLICGASCAGLQQWYASSFDEVAAKCWAFRDRASYF